MVNRVQENFTIVVNSVLNNGDLSLKAKGLYAFLCSKPTDGSFQFSYDGLSHQLKEGVKAIRSAVKELVLANLLLRYSTQTRAGEFDGWEWVINPSEDDLKKFSDPFYGHSQKGNDRKGNDQNGNEKIVIKKSNKEKIPPLSPPEKKLTKTETAIKDLKLNKEEEKVFDWLKEILPYCKDHIKLATLAKKHGAKSTRIIHKRIKRDIDKGTISSVAAILARMETLDRLETPKKTRQTILAEKASREPQSNEKRIWEDPKLKKVFSNIELPWSTNG